MKSLKILTLCISFFFAGCGHNAATTAHCPPGKVRMSLKDAREVIRTLGIASVYSEKWALECGDQTLAQSFHQLAKTFERLDQRALNEGELNADMLEDAFFQYGDNYTSLKRNCPEQSLPVHT